MIRILHILAQKPVDTGSGVFFTSTIEALDRKGYKQGTIAGMTAGESLEINTREELKVYPVWFESSELPFPVVGMSDAMPYESTKYIDLNEEMLQKWQNAFKEKIKKAVEEFDPHFILCHHLYLLTAFVKELYPEKKILGICHGTDLRQLGKHNLRKEYIIENIKKLDGILAHHEEEKEQIIEVFGIEKEKVQVSITGYNDKIFFDSGRKKATDKIKMVFTGKISAAKGVEALLRAYSILPLSKEEVELYLVGAGVGEEYKQIEEIAKKCSLPIKFLGKLSQEKLAKLYEECHIFILPSFYEALPLVFIEALACGLSAIVSDIKGVKKMTGAKINESGKVNYVPLPKLKEMDLPCEEELPSYEQALAESIIQMISKVKEGILEVKVDVSHLTWDRLAERIEKFF